MNESQQQEPDAYNRKLSQQLEQEWIELRKLQKAEQPVQPQQEPFGYFKPEPFGWTDCAETDEGAIALYDRPPASKPLNWEPIQEFWRNNSSIDWDELEAAIEAAHGIKEKNGG